MSQLTTTSDKANTSPFLLKKKQHNKNNKKTKINQKTKQNEKNKKGWDTVKTKFLP